MTTPTDDWYWDDDTECVMARDAADKRGGDIAEVDFYEPHIGKLAAAAPDMARALLELGRSGWHGADREWHLGVCWGQLSERGAECLQGCRDARAALTKAGVPLP